MSWIGLQKGSLTSLENMPGYKATFDEYPLESKTPSSEDSTSNSNSLRVTTNYHEKPSKFYASLRTLYWSRSLGVHEGPKGLANLEFLGARCEKFFGTMKM